MNKLTTEQFTKLKGLMSDVKTEGYSKYTTIQGPNKKRLKTQFIPVSFENKELVNFLCDVAKQDTLKVKNIMIEKICQKHGMSMLKHLYTRNIAINLEVGLFIMDLKKNG